MGGKESALLTVLLFLAHASHTGAQQILLVAIAHFYTVPDVYTVLHKFQRIFFFFPRESSSSFVPQNTTKVVRVGDYEIVIRPDCEK